MNLHRLFVALGTAFTAMGTTTSGAVGAAMTAVGALLLVIANPTKVGPQKNDEPPTCAS